MKRGLKTQIQPIDDACNVGLSMSTKTKIIFVLTEIKDFIKGLITFIKHIPGYYKLYQWYGYDPMDYDFIIHHYQRVLDERTKRMSKPTYNWRDVVMELDMYYEEIYKEEIDRLEKDIEQLEKDNRWILVKDQLPYIYEESKTSDTVLVQGYDKDTDYYWQAMGFYAAEPKQWYFAECKNTDKPIDWIDIIAWQPLPEDLKFYKKKEIL